MSSVDVSIHRVVRVQVREKVFPSDTQCPEFTRTTIEVTDVNGETVSFRLFSDESLTLELGNG